MDIKSERIIRDKLKKIGLNDFSILCILESVKLCRRKRIHILDINMKKVVYPYLGNKFNKAATTVESLLIDDIKNVWSNNKASISKILKYKNKPTTKKLIALMLLSIK